MKKMLSAALTAALLMGTPVPAGAAEEEVTRQQLAVRLYEEAGTPAVFGDLLPYADRDRIAGWAEDAVHWCVASGILRGRSPEILAPDGTVKAAEAALMEQRFAALPDVTAVQADLDALAAQRRPAGSLGEQAAAQYLAARFEDMGYTVTLQPYTRDGETVGHNVIASRGGAGDILVISAHHDSVDTAFGANDNASGTAALLRIAEALKEIDSDTELRFVSFTDEESGKKGSRLYVESLPAEERARMVGCIQLDMLGGLGGGGHILCTTDGSPNWLTEQLGQGASLAAETGSDHAIFQLAGIPAVLVTQQDRGYLYHTAGDAPAALNPYAICRAADVVTAALRQIASRETGSYIGTARQQAGSYVYRHSRSSRILFSATREENEAYLGFTGRLTDSWEDKGEGWSDLYEVYTYDMGWFGGETLMPTEYIYRNGYLGDVRILPNGYTAEQLVRMISATHGQPAEGSQPGSWNWEDALYGKFISLQETDGALEIALYPYSLGISNTLASYDVTGGQADIDDPRHAQVWALLCTALPAEHRQKIGQFQLFTDGFSNILAYTAAMGDPAQPDNSRFTLSVDYYDVYDEHGVPRDRSKLLFTIIHEYGHVLLENDSQIDVAVEPDLHDPAGLIEGSFRQRYYETFWQDPYTSHLGSYWDHPAHYVSPYAGNMFHEDIADTFAVFVFADRPAGDSIAEQKLRFFWEDADMVELRRDIRQGLGLR